MGDFPTMVLAATDGSPQAHLRMGRAGVEIVELAEDLARTWSSSAAGASGASATPIAPSSSSGKRRPAP